MRRFNAPPGWPTPPNVRWRPPKGWVPHESWPDAPAGWAFWINEHGRRVAGPVGRYGGLSRVWVAAGGAVLVLLMFVACGPLSSGARDPVASGTSSVPPATATDTAETEPGDDASPTPPATTTEPTASPTPSVPSPARTATTPAPRPAPTTTSRTTEPPKATPSDPPGGVYYKNCGAVRAAGAAPLHRGEPGYSAHLDPDGDGVACARGGR